MSAAHPGRDWTAMDRAEFDLDAPIALPVPTGPARILAAPDPCGTEALFGETVPERQRRCQKPPNPGDASGQDELF